MAEEKFLHECGGEKLYRLIAQKYDVSYNVFRIGLFGHLLYFTTSGRESKLKAFFAQCAFAAGYLFGYWLSLRRKIIPKTFETNADYLVFSEQTPNQIRHTKKIQNFEGSKRSFKRSAYIHLKDIIKGKEPSDSLLMVTRERHAKKNVNHAALQQVVDAIRPAFVIFPAHPRHWFRYGIAISPVLACVVDGSRQLASIWNGDVVYFTQPMELTSILAESFREKGTRTVFWFHGIIGMAYSVRSVCDEGAVCRISDAEILKRYSFEKSYWLQPQRVNKVFKSFPSRVDRFGYATNLMARLGPQPCLDEIKNPQLVNDGKRCNEILCEFITKTVIPRLYFKLHPREIASSYKNVFENITKEGNCEVELLQDFDTFLAHIDHCVCHPSSVAIELLDNGKRVYMYRPCFTDYDSETSIGKVIELVGFNDVEQLEKLFSLSDQDYWLLVSSLLGPIQPNDF